jgi:hypothetical protein
VELGTGLRVDKMLRELFGSVERIRRTETLIVCFDAQTFWHLPRQHAVDSRGSTEPFCFALLALPGHHLATEAPIMTMGLSELLTPEHGEHNDVRTSITYFRRQRNIA